MSRLYLWLLNTVYLLAMVVALPWILWSAIRHGKYRDGFGEKLLGRAPWRANDGPCVWLHAVSVGEVNLLATTIAEIKRHRPDWQLVISTTTKTGYDLARRKYAGHTVFYCPLDFSWAVRTAMRRVRPDLLVLVELELWPNLIGAAKHCGARVAIINGRLSDRSFRGYRRLRPLIARLLRQIDLIAAQDQASANRFIEQGAAAESVHDTGSLKFDGAETDRRNPRSCELRNLAQFSEEDVVWLVGSTQAPEEQYALDVFEKLRVDYPRLRLVIVPRHPQRFAEVARLLDREGFDWQRRSVLRPASRSDAAIDASRTASPSRVATRRRAPPILLVDTVGELSAWWGTATIGFVGGSFGSRGGQNMLEPAAYGVATCFGPNTQHFRNTVAQLLAANAAVVVEDRDALEQFVRRALNDPRWASDLGRRARELVIAGQGATRRTVEMLLPLIDGREAQRSRAA